LDKKIRRKPARRLPRSSIIVSDFISNQLGEHSSKMFMNDRTPPGPHPVFARVPVLIVVLENRKAERRQPLVTRCRGRQSRRVNRAKHVMDATDQQFVFVPEMHVKSRSANVGAIQNLFHRDGVIVLFANQ